MVISDNGPQFSSEAFAEFSKKYQFEHKTSSPYYPQCNGEAERAVGTIKRMLNKEGDPYLALLAYRTTPLQIGYSPSELLMCRKLRSTVPLLRSQRTPQVPDAESVRSRDQDNKRKTLIGTMEQESCLISLLVIMCGCQIETLKQWLENRQPPGLTLLSLLMVLHVETEKTSFTWTTQLTLSL